MNLIGMNTGISDDVRSVLPDKRPPVAAQLYIFDVNVCHQKAEDDPRQDFKVRLGFVWNWNDRFGQSKICDLKCQHPDEKDDEQAKYS